MMSTSTEKTGNNMNETDWTDLGARMWSFLTGREAAINYEFQNMEIEVPRDTGSDAPRATWRLSGTLRVTTDDNVSGQSA